MYDLLKLQATLHDLEHEAFGPNPTGQIQQIVHHPPQDVISLEELLNDTNSDRPILQWLSWHATAADAKRAYLALHTAGAWALSGDQDLPECADALRILREAPTAKNLIRHVLNHSDSAN